jgi:HSP20 family protein
VLGPDEETMDDKNQSLEGSLNALLDRTARTSESSVNHLRAVSREDPTPDAPVWDPPFDVRDSRQEMVVFVDLPGMDEDDIEIHLQNAELRVQGTREFDHDTEDAEEFITIERPYGSFDLHINVPVSVDPEQISAKYKRGVLKVRLPKRLTSQAVHVGRSV